MNIAFIIIAISLVALIIFLLLKKKPQPQLKIVKDQIAQDQPRSAKDAMPKVDQVRDFHEIADIVENLKESTAVRPEGNQQRNLDRELGGVEVGEYKETGEKDVWDERSNQIDQEGSIDQLGSAGKKSMIWRKKKEKIDEKKMDKARDASEAHQENRKQGTGTGFDSRYGNQAGFGQMIKARNDFGNDRGGGGMSR
jgi:hypothetical protein